MNKSNTDSPIDFNSSFDFKFLQKYQKGTLSYKYKGLSFLKNPIDLAIYMKLIWDLRPRTIIEIGSKDGGSATFIADILETYKFDCPVISIDLEKPQLPPDPRITFMTGDVNDIAMIIQDSAIANMPHPWLVIEDSAHTYEGCMATLNAFSEAMVTGDILAIEDGILDELGLSGKYNGGPNRALKEFFDNNPSDFDVIREYCDMFGPNATYNPNGYLRKT